jgi:hypothetical protein
MSTILDELNNQLWEAGVPRSESRFLKHANDYELVYDTPISIFIHTKLDASPYSDIFLEFAPKLTEPNEIVAVVRCMTQPKGFSAAVPWLLSLFNNFPENGLDSGYLWAVGNALYVIDDKKYYSRIIEICRNREYGSARQMLMGTLARTKSNDAYAVLVDCLNDPSVKGHAIEGLGRFGREDAISILEATPVNKGLYEFKAKKTALRRLNKKFSMKSQ